MYGTYYSMEVRGITGTKLADLADELVSMGIINYALSNPYLCENGAAFFESADEVSWCDHTEQMVEVSKHFPDMTFCLHGEGERNGDIWNEYFRNGECETCNAEIVMPKPEKIAWEED